MAQKKEESKEIKELKEKILAKKVILGTEKVLKSLRQGELSKVFLASNSTDKLRQDVEYYTKLAKILVIKLDLNNEDLGILCKKNFFVTVIGILR